MLCVARLLFHQLVNFFQVSAESIIIKPKSQQKFIGHIKPDIINSKRMLQCFRLM